MMRIFLASQCWGLGKADELLSRGLAACNGSDQAILLPSQCLTSINRSHMKFVIVAGARPNFMKIAPIMDAFRDQTRNFPGSEVLLVHTGQHYDQKMSDDFFKDLGIP